MLKSANCTIRGSVAVTVLGLVVELVESWDVMVAVPITVKLSDDDESPPRLPTVRVLDWPGTIEGGLNAQVAGEILEQLRAMDPVNPTVVEAVTVNCTWPVPCSTVSELGFAARVKGRTPVPVRVIV